MPRKEAFLAAIGARRHLCIGPERPDEVRLVGKTAVESDGRQRHRRVVHEVHRVQVFFVEQDFFGIHFGQIVHLPGKLAGRVADRSSQLSNGRWRRMGIAQKLIQQGILKVQVQHFAFYPVHDDSYSFFKGWLFNDLIPKLTKKRVNQLQFNDAIPEFPCRRTEQPFYGSRVELHAKVRLLFGKLEQNGARVDAVDETPAGGINFAAQRGMYQGIAAIKNDFYHPFGKDDFRAKAMHPIRLPDVADNALQVARRRYVVVVLQSFW